MKSVVRFTLRQTVLLNLLFVLLIIIGAFSMLTLPVERYPNVDMGKVIVVGVLPGASPDEVEALVTRKIEDALDGLENVEFVRASSYRQRSSVVVKFIDDTDYDAQYDELRFRVLSIQNDLPEEMDPPEFIKIDMDVWVPVMSINLVGDRSNRALTLMAEELKIHLERLNGVKEVNVEGEHLREFHVELDPTRMSRYGVTFNEVAEALQKSNVSVPAGDFSSRGKEFVLLVDERFRTREDIAETIIRRDGDGSFVRVEDVMSAAFVSYREPEVIASVNGRDSVAVNVVKLDEGNALDIGEEVERILAEYQPVLEREGVQAIITLDQRKHIDQAMSTLGSNLLLGIILVCAVIWVVMGFRNAMVTSVGIPFAFLVTMVLMKLTGNSLNEITLFSFVLVAGIIVDDAIVVVENIYRHVQEGASLRNAVVDGTAEVALPIVSATATTVAAFLPMLIMTGSTGQFFALIPKAISFALVASLVECLFILPLHFLDWPGRGKLMQGAAAHTEDKAFMIALRNLAERGLRIALRFRWVTLGSVLMAFVVALFIFGVSMSGVMPLLRIKFFPDSYTTFYITVEAPEATPITTTSDQIREFGRFMESLGSGMTRSASGVAGYYLDEDYQTVHGSNLGMVTVELPVTSQQHFADYPDNDPQAHLDDIRKRVAERTPEGWSILVRPEKDGPPVGKDVNVRILGSDPVSVSKLTAEIRGFLEQQENIGPHLIDLADDTGQPNYVFRFRPREDRVAEYGLDTSTVAGLAGSVLDGRFVGEFRLADEDVDLRLKIDNGFLQRPEDALDVPVLEHNSGPVRLGDLCTVSSYKEVGQLNRYQRQRAITLTANIKPGAPISTQYIIHAVKQHYTSIEREYPGATLDFSGEFASTQRSYQSLMIAFFMALLIIYVILATQFQSYVQPLIILSAVVFALTGVVFGTFFTRTLLTVNSFVATVGVTGVVVNDSLVLVDFMNKLYRKGLNRTDAAIQGMRIRLRPILLTTLTTMLGLLPMAVGIPSYSLVWGTMASTFVTGLCTATLLTLFVIPIQWHLVMGYHEWRQKKFGKPVYEEVAADEGASSSEK
ncbi:efflux RND transporter permease subunit [Oleidesulfovibrio sp.]|uniref:efflux RND transporter permease subunit n=1 Tax=Oleidesulfovibrio sp. TaxID=2909707 RepID=UPI003A896B19